MYYVMYNVGKAKYLLNTHNGVDIHNVGCEIFKNKKKLQARIAELKKDGYAERGGN